MPVISTIMETIMIICFGLSWPLNITRAWKARTAKGTSILFYSFIWVGYVCAIIGKIALIVANAPQPWYVTVKWYVLFFYVLNTLMVTCGILIYFRNKALDKKKAN